MVEPGKLILCADPERNAWLQSLVQRSVAFLLSQLRTWKVEAILLTGSAARGEASVLYHDHHYRLLGDIEFLVVVQPLHNWPLLRRRTLDLSRQATWKLGKGGQAACIEYGPAGLKYLRRTIRPSMFAYDLRMHGRVVWGRQDILSEIPPFEVTDIPAEDAINLLMNRLIETMMWQRRHLHANTRDTMNRAYHAVKVTLDQAGSVLAFTGRYVSSYAKRAQGFRDVLQHTAELWTTQPQAEQFLSALDHAVHCKLEPTLARLAACLRPGAQLQQETWGRALWVWEVSQLCGLDKLRFSDALEVYLHRESLARRLRGWLKFVCHPLRPTGALSWQHMLRLLPYASPQTLTYAAAMLTSAGCAGEVPPDWQKRVAELLPLPTSPACSDQVTDLGNLWQWLIRNN